VGPALPLPLHMADENFHTQCLAEEPARGLIRRERWDSRRREGEGTQPRGVRLPPPPRKEITSARPPCPPPWISPQRALGPLSNNHSRILAPSASACVVPQGDGLAQARASYLWGAYRTMEA
jgi:hypothetical protein